MEKAQLFLENHTCEKTTVFYALPESGSSRRNYFATAGGKDFIITSNSNLTENESFFYLTKVFTELKLNTPQIYRISDDRTMYIQEYLGGQTLSEIIAEEGESGRVNILVRKSLKNLYQLQKSSLNKVDFSNTFEYEAYDDLPVQNDLFYFKSFIADVLELPYHKSNLLKEFRQLTEKLSDLGPRCVMLRDFQARNIMVNDADEVFFIDYQSAMEGPGMYDVISFLFQAKANFSPEFREEMLQYYFSMYDDLTIRQELQASLGPLQLVRFMQVLGAYGFRGLIQKKSHFVTSLKAGIENLSQFSNNWYDMQHYPELKQLIAVLKTEETNKKIKEILT